jgi:hypothetical protein
VINVSTPLRAFSNFSFRAAGKPKFAIRPSWVDQSRLSGKSRRNSLRPEGSRTRSSHLSFARRSFAARPHPTPGLLGYLLGCGRDRCWLGRAGKRFPLCEDPMVLVDRQLCSDPQRPTKRPVFGASQLHYQQCPRIVPTPEELASAVEKWLARDAEQLLLSTQICLVTAGPPVWRNGD